MWRCPLALAAFTLALSTRSAARADVPFNGISIGAPMSKVAHILGPPDAVSSSDSGHRFAFAGGTVAYTDDDGIVLAVATQTGSPRIDIDGKVRTFGLGEYSLTQADAELVDVAEFATADRRSYRLAPRRDMVLEFASVSRRLKRLSYGEPGQLARLGLLAGDAAAKAVVFRAPLLKSTQEDSPSPAKPPCIYRITIDRAGSVTGVALALQVCNADSTGESQRRLRTERYVPATLNGRPIAATIFVRYSG